MKILIADDHWVVRDSLKQVIKRVEKTIVVFEAATFDEALAILRQNPDIDLMLVDLIMPGFEEFEGLRKLRAQFGDIPVVIVSVHEDIEYIARSVSHGVIGYIPKSAGGKEITHALERVLQGEVSFPRHILESGAPGRPTNPMTPVAEEPANSLADLTNRETEVLERLGQGYSVRRIAEELVLSPQTVRVHLSSMMKKLGFRDRSAAIHYAVNLANRTKWGERR